MTVGMRAIVAGLVVALGVGGCASPVDRYEAARMEVAFVGVEEPVVLLKTGGAGEAVGVATVVRTRKAAQEYVEEISNYGTIPLADLPAALEGAVLVEARVARVVGVGGRPSDEVRDALAGAGWSLVGPLARDEEVWVRE
jgi:hypothetical protein